MQYKIDRALPHPFDYRCWFKMAKVDDETARGSRSPGRPKGPVLKHKTRSPGDSVKESERSLQKLLEDFEDGKLNAFGN